MELNSLNAISPVDGRYYKVCEPLTYYFSEEALIKYRVKVEVEYFIALCELPLPQLAKVPSECYADLRKLYEIFSSEDAIRIKNIERTTNHDVKAVEYFLKEEFDKLNLSNYKEFIHFGLTSQDINNTSIPLSVQESLNDVYFKELKQLLEKLHELSTAWQGIPMLARTHGQPASPTQLGKEIYIFKHRIEQQLIQLQEIPNTAKFGGATGNFNAHVVAYPQIDWENFANKFVLNLGLKRSPFTTQIESYDNMAALFDAMKRINTILIDLSRDIWTYISMNYFTQKVVANEVGSSAMPHKVNPIDFENAEGNLGLSNAMLEHLSSKLPVSRLQRDLTDSTVLRNIGVPFAHISIALASLIKGLNKITVNKDILHADLENNWAVVAEAIQTILRREGYPNPYEALKALTRTGDKITEQTIKEFIQTLSVHTDIKEELLKITPHNYTGIKYHY